MKKDSGFFHELVHFVQRIKPFGNKPSNGLLYRESSKKQRFGWSRKT
ncbi:MAG TPA: hypothetical protein VMV20_04640 [Chitinophagaceae bacterium]|nr:hypothetical protein [Chitinophagaceae bacterium]